MHAHSIRTDAIIIESNGDVRIQNLSQEIFQAADSYYEQLSTRFGFDTGNYDDEESEMQSWMQSNCKMREFLRWLWKIIVYPVL